MTNHYTPKNNAERQEIGELMSVAVAARQIFGRDVPQLEVALGDQSRAIPTDLLKAVGFEPPVRNEEPPLRPRTPPPNQGMQTDRMEPHVRRFVMAKALTAKANGAIGAAEIVKVEVSLGAGRQIEPRILKAIDFNPETVEVEALLGEFMKGGSR